MPKQAPVWRPDPEPQKPRLVVQLTVDQLRADVLARMQARFGAGGFRRFLDEGLDFKSARYAHAATETAPGHATLSTGALPSDHGIVANEWFDPALGRARFSVEDEQAPILGSQGPLERGASPRALEATTLGDELWLKSFGSALVYSVSIKDRAAILSGGHSAKAFWLDDALGGMVTSQYYFAELPSWVAAFNRTHDATKIAGLRWELLEPKQHYLRAAHDDASWEHPPQGWSRTFPHVLADVAPAARFSALRRTPFADELTLEFVAALLDHVPLGMDETPDLLAVSFSATDYIGHAFGPESLEAEDQLLRLDRIVARLFEVLLARVPKERLLVVLSADHGGSESPEHLEALGLPGGRHDVRALIERLNGALDATYGQGPALVQGFVNPYLWLDESAVLARGLWLEQVEERLAELVRREPGFARAYTRDSLLRNALGDDPVSERVRRSFHPKRSGHVYLVPSTGWLLAADADRIASMHGTPHRYDTDVPLSFYGLNLAPRHVYEAVDPRDIAVTLATLLAVKVPSAASGRVLDAVAPARR